MTLAKPILTNLLLFLFFHSGAQQNAGNKLVKTIDRDFLQGCETGRGPCESFKLDRTFVGDSTQLVFPCGGTSGTVYLFAEGKTDPIATHSILGCATPLKLDLTALPDGSYTARMISCSLGGAFELTLRTNRK